VQRVAALVLLLHAEQALFRRPEREGEALRAHLVPAGEVDVLLEAQVGRVVDDQPRGARLARGQGRAALAMECGQLEEAGAHLLRQLLLHFLAQGGLVRPARAAERQGERSGHEKRPQDAPAPRVPHRQYPTHGMAR
jgi:hypothetical protein